MGNKNLLKKGTEYAEFIRLQQEINRNYATLYASATDAVLRIIKVRYGHVKTAINELRETLIFAMK